MKIDAVLARHPWPWHVVAPPQEWLPPLWEVRDARNDLVFNDDAMPIYRENALTESTRDAILELVEAHVAAAGRSSKEAKEDKQ